eukprot:PhF_6_TR42707/c0_g1_i5/m.64512
MFPKTLQHNPDFSGLPHPPTYPHHHATTKRTIVGMNPGVIRPSTGSSRVSSAHNNTNGIRIHNSHSTTSNNESHVNVLPFRRGVGSARRRIVMSSVDFDLNHDVAAPPLLPEVVQPSSIHGAAYLRSNLRTFFQRFEEDLTSFQSGSVVCEMALRDLFHETENLPRPNVLRTTGCCALLVKLCHTFSCQQTVMRKLLDEVLCAVFVEYADAIYSNPKAQENMESFVTMNTYADTLSTANRRIAELEAQIIQNESQHDKQSETLDRVIRVWQRMLKERIFFAWRGIPKEKARRRVALENAIRGRVERRIQRSCLAAWKCVTKEDRMQKALEYSNKESRLLMETCRNLQIDARRMKYEGDELKRQ